MSIKVAQNFDYKGRLPNFERDSFDTLELLKNSNPDWFDDGHITYCKETDKHYVFNKSNPYDTNTGYFKVLKTDAQVIGDASIHQGDVAPENKELIWLDTSVKYYDQGDVATVESLQEAVRLLTSEMTSLKTFKTNGIVAGTVSDSVRNELADPDNAEKPVTGLDDVDNASTTIPDYSDLEEVEPDYEDAKEPNVPHISIKMGTYSQLQAYIKNFIPGELLWCTNKKKLYIYINGSLVTVGGGTVTDDEDDNGNNEGTTDMDTEEILNLVQGQLQQVESIGFIPVGSTEPKYTVKVSADGTLLCYDKTLDTWNPTPDENYYFADSVSHSGLLINSFYLGGDGDEHSYQPCSHNYVEISNVWMKSKTADQKDINLNGFYLLYLHKIGDSGVWKALPLWGTIKANSTFVIRGAQCSVMDANTTVIKVKNYDMEWMDVTGVDKDGNNIYEPIKFDQDNAVFYLAWSDPNNPGQFYTMDDSDNSVKLSDFPTGINKLIDVDKGGCAKGYVDLESFNNNIICEKKTYQLPDGVNAKDMLFRRWYPMDPVGQSNPDDGLTAHSNIKYLTATYLNGSNWDDRIPVKEWTPKASWEGKSMAETRSLFLEDKPNALTITFGHQGSDNSENGGRGAIRGFNWNSVGYYDEYLWIRKEGDSDWEKVESIKDAVYFDSNNALGASVKAKADKDGKKYKDAANYKLFTWPETILSDERYESQYLKYFTRKRWESSYGQVMTTHKVVLDGLKAGNYEYKVVRGTDENSPYQSKVRKFKVHKDSELKNFSYVHTTDQQAVTWEEWETWTLTARMMRKQYKRPKDVLEAGVVNGLNVTYEADGMPKYISFSTPEGDFGLVYASKYSSDSLTGDFVDSDGKKLEGATITGVTTDSDRAKTISMEIGTIPNDYKFVINTGDVCYNGTRSNEWLDYFYSQEPLDDREEMLCVGNNDLIPPSMRDIGTGQESPWKINPEVIDYFYAVDFDVNNPPVFLGTANDGSGTVSFKIPGLYSFNYGSFHFICLLSEIRTISNKVDNAATGANKKLSQSTVNEVWKVKDELRSANNNQASKIYDTVEGWITKDLMLWRGCTPDYINENYYDGDINNMNYKWQEARFDKNILGQCERCFVYTHEMPFNITSSPSYANYSSGNAVPRETAKAYLNRMHNFEFQRLFKLAGIRMVMGGHKHTVAITRPVYDAPIGYNPITGKMHPEYYDGSYKGKDGQTGVSIGYYLNEEYDQIFNDTRIDSATEKLDNGEIKTYYVLNDNGAFSHPSSFRPFIQVTPEEWERDRSTYEQWTNEIYNNSSNEIIYTHTGNGIETSTQYLRGAYQNESNFIQVDAETPTFINTLIASNTLTKAGMYPRCRIEIVDGHNSPSYIMAQTAGFKNKSNSDLACKSTDGIIPWERFYVAGNSISKQCAPHYGVYHVSTVDENGNDLDSPKIDVYMYRVSGMYKDTGNSSDGGSPAGYWSLAEIYKHGETLEENRGYFTGTWPVPENANDDEAGVLKIELFNTGGTSISICPAKRKSSVDDSASTVSPEVTTPMPDISETTLEPNS